MKTISCAFHRRKGNGHDEGRVEIVGVTRSTRKKTAPPPKSPAFSFDYNEREALVIGESLDERERKG
jgi:hypothetical protein